VSNISAQHALWYTFEILFVDTKDCLGHQKCSQLYVACEKRGPPIKIRFKRFLNKALI